MALEPAAAQGNPVCSEESGTLVNMIEGFIQITTALGLMGLLVVWQADELADMFTMNQQQALALKQHKRQAMKSAAILVLLGPLFTIAGSAMSLPIAQFADDIAHGRSPELYGDGTQTRDFTHVDDIVRGLELAADDELDGVFNLGTGERYSFNTVVELLNEELGTDVEPEYVENPIPDDVYVHDTCADASNMREATGWEPEISFEEGLAMVCEPYQPAEAE